MKTFKSILILISFSLMLSSCGSGGGSKKEEKMKEPVNQAEFEKLLSDYGISLYAGSEFVEIKTGANSEITYVVKSEEKDFVKKLTEYYKDQFSAALTSEKGWGKVMDISYVKNDFSFVFGAAIFPKIMISEEPSLQEYKYMIFFGDNAVSY